MPIAVSVRIVAWMETAWLVRYLDRELSDDEAVAFEAYVLDKPELLAQIEADTNLRDTLRNAALNTPGDVLDQHPASDVQAHVTDVR
jgi:anti-sigma factor RsiW